MANTLQILFGCFCALLLVALCSYNPPKEEHVPRWGSEIMDPTNWNTETDMIYPKDTKARKAIERELRELYGK